MNQLWQELEALESTQGNLNKQSQLAAILSTDDGEAFIRTSFNGIVYGLDEKTFYNAFDGKKQKDVSEFVRVFGSGDNDYLQSDLLLYSHNEKPLSGGALQEYLKDMFICMTPLAAKWHCRMLLHDLKCGIQITSVNKVLKELDKQTIDIFELQLCDTMDFDDPKLVKKLELPAFVEVKYDGIRTYAVVKDGNVKLMSRHGNEITTFPEIVNELGRVFRYHDIILDGEVISSDFQDLSTRIHRKEENINSEIKLVYKIFDLLESEGTSFFDKSQTTRRQVLQIICQKSINFAGTEMLSLSESIVCNDLSQVKKMYDDCCSRKEEGIIIKPLSRSYDPGSRKNWWKVKPVHTADLKIVGYQLGDGRKSEVVGSLMLEDASRTVKCDVGSGISDEWSVTLTYMTRPMLTEAEKLIGKIAEIKYNEITKTGSIRFPRFVTLRDDKSIPDDLSKRSLR